MPAINAIVVDDDIIEARVYCTQDDQTSVNITHWKVFYSAGSGLSLDDFALTFDGAMAPVYKDLLGQNANYYGVEARIVFPVVRKSLARSSKSAPGPGLNVADSLPKQTCGMFTKQTGVPGVAGRGRMYVPFPAENNNDATAIPTVGYMVFLGTLAGKVTSAFAVTNGGNTMQMAPVLFSRPEPAAVPPFAGGWQLLIGATARRKWATHRSRGTYGRPNPPPF